MVTTDTNIVLLFYSAQASIKHQNILTWVKLLKNRDKWGNLNQILINYILKKSYRVRGGRVWLNFPNPSVGGCGIDTDEAIMSRPPGPLTHWASPLFSTHQRLCPPPNNDFRALSTHDKFFWAPTRLGTHNLELGKNIDCIPKVHSPNVFHNFSIYG